MQDSENARGPQATSWPSEVTVSVSTGKSQNFGLVTKAVETTLDRWLAAQLKTPREGVLAAQEYADLCLAAETDKGAKARKDAEKAAWHWYSFASYVDNHRKAANWQGSNIAVLDADAKYGTREGAQYSFKPDDLRQRLDGLKFIAVPTHSFTESVPRWRIVIPLSECVTDRREFEAVAKHLGGLLNGYVDPRSYTPEQLWFAFSAPKGEWNKRRSLIMVEG